MLFCTPVIRFLRIVENGSRDTLGIDHENRPDRIAPFCRMQHTQLFRDPVVTGDNRKNDFDIEFLFDPLDMAEDLIHGHTDPATLIQRVQLL